MLCPVCQETLLMTDRQGIELDYCPKCRGIWLDRGELEKLIEKSVLNMNTTIRLGDRRPHDNDDDQYRARREESHDYSKYKKRESWLGRILDFD